MFEFTLLKSLYFELDKYNMEGATEEKSGMSTFRSIDVNYANVPQITSITMEERILPMVDRYYIYLNHEERPRESTREPEVAQVIYEFYKDHFPSYLKADLPEILGDYSILDCFEVFNMPDYRPKHAFPGIVTLEDVKNGKVKLDERIATFPGLQMLKPDAGKPAISGYKGYVGFDADEETARDQAKNKLEDMKKTFAAELAGLDIPDIEKIKEEAIRLEKEERGKGLFEE